MSSWQRLLVQQVGLGQVWVLVSRDSLTTYASCMTDSCIAVVHHGLPLQLIDASTQAWNEVSSVVVLYVGDLIPRLSTSTNQLQWQTMVYNRYAAVSHATGISCQGISANKHPYVYLYKHPYIYVCMPSMKPRQGATHKSCPKSSE